MSDLKKELRNFELLDIGAAVREHNRKMRQNQTLDYVQKMHNKYLTLDKPMLPWDALIELNRLMDVRDPDLLISEIRKNKM